MVVVWPRGGSGPGRVSGPGRGGYLPGPGVSGPRRVPPWFGEVSGPRRVPPWSGGGTCLVRLGGDGAWSGTPPVNRITHTCKNITLAKTSFRPVIINIHLRKLRPELSPHVSYLVTL